jgi:hypothetical protein
VASAPHATEGWARARQFSVIDWHAAEEKRNAQLAPDVLTNVYTEVSIGVARFLGNAVVRETDRCVIAVRQLGRVQVERFKPWTQTQRDRRSVMFVHVVEALLVGLQKQFPAGRSTFLCPVLRSPAPFVSGRDYDESRSSSSTRYPASLSTSGTSSRHAMSPKCSSPK